MRFFLCVVLLAAVLDGAAAFIAGGRGQGWLRQPSAQVAQRAAPLSAIKLVVSDETEPIENVLKRFKRAVNQSGHLMELRHRELWETAADKRKRKAERARQLNRIERTNDRYERKNDGASEYNS